MNPWGFVILAYGIVWSAILLYLFLLKRRLCKLHRELLRLRSREDEKSNA